EHDLLGLLRKLLEYLVLGAAEQERRDEPLERERLELRGRVAAPAIEALEARKRAQVARQDELHDRPQVGGLVLYRRSRHGDAELGLERAGGAGADGRGVLD